MTITLHDYQIKAAEVLKREVEAGGDVRFLMPVGSGRSAAMIEAVRDMPSVAIISKHRQMHRQMVDMCERMGVTNVTCIREGEAVDGYYAIVLGEDAAQVDIDHPRIVRMAAMGSF